MSISNFTIRDLLQAGVHFGHHPRRWNPKMQKYIFGVRNSIHIINLDQTAILLNQALQVIYDTAKVGGRILFVGTKKQAGSYVAKYAELCGQYYVNHRWLGGMMTNWKTVSQSIKKLKEYEAILSREDLALTKKEILKIERSHNKLHRSLGGIKELGGTPDLIIVLDSNKEKIAVQEAKSIGIPVVGVVDTNSDPDDIDFPIPGNDDAMRSIEIYLKLMSETVLSGIKEQMVAAGIDLGESEDSSGESDKKLSKELSEQFTDSAASVESDNTKSISDEKDQAKEKIETVTADKDIASTSSTDTTK